jgi:hypothetical protein
VLLFSLQCFHFKSRLDPSKEEKENKKSLREQGQKDERKISDKGVRKLRMISEPTKKAFTKRSGILRETVILLCQNKEGPSI